MSQPILQKDTLRRINISTEETPILHSLYMAYKTPHSQTEEKRRPYENHSNIKSKEKMNYICGNSRCSKLQQRNY